MSKLNETSYRAFIGGGGVFALLADFYGMLRTQYQ